MTGEFQPGQIYSEQALAGDMGISKTPVHQALLDLANKGFVTIIPRRGFQVNTLMERNIRNLFQFRQPLELTVVRFAAPTLTPAALNDLEGILARMSGVRDPYEFQKFDRAFHRYLASLTENELIIQALENVWDLSDWVGARVLAKADRYEENSQGAHCHPGPTLDPVMRKPRPRPWMLI